MKIIIATPLYPPDIAEPAPYVKELAKNLRHKHDITVVAYANNPEKISRVKIVAVSKRDWLPVRLIKYTLALYKASKGTDVIYVQNGPSVDFPAIIVGKITGINVIIRFSHDKAWERAVQLRLTDKNQEEFLKYSNGNLQVRLIMALQKFAFRQALLITAPSVYLTTIIANAYKIEKKRIIVLYNPPEKEQILPFTSAIIPYQILIHTSLIKEKKLQEIIYAVLLLKKDFPSTKLIVAGIGQEETNLKKLVQELDLHDSVSFIGHVSRAESWHIRKSSQIYLQNPKNEDTPCDIINTFVAETTLITIKNDMTSEAVVNGESGILTENWNRSELVSVISQLFKDHEMRKKLSGGGQRTLSEKFSWETHIHNLNLILESIKK